MEKFDKTVRRHYMALFKVKIQKEVEYLNEYYDEKPDTARLQSYRESRIRYAYRNDGRYVRTKEARGGFGYICGCDWCIDNWTFSSRKEIARIRDEECDYVRLGYPVNWEGDDFLDEIEDFPQM